MKRRVKVGDDGGFIVSGQSLGRDLVLWRVFVDLQVFSGGLNFIFGGVLAHLQALASTLRGGRTLANAKFA